MHCTITYFIYLYFIINISWNITDRIVLHSALVLGHIRHNKLSYNKHTDEEYQLYDTHIFDSNEETVKYQL